MTKVLFSFEIAPKIGKIFSQKNFLICINNRIFDIYYNNLKQTIHGNLYRGG